MTACVMTQERRLGNPVPFLSIAWLFFLVVALILAITIVYMTHAVERHGEDALKVRECLKRGGLLTTWINPANGRKAHICQIAENLFGVQIVEEDLEEVTAFIKTKMKRVEQVFKYLSNGGYTPIVP